MLTISLIKNSSGAAQYYAKEDNYYLSEVDAKEASLWYGKGAVELGFSGKKVEEKDLQNLLEGKLPNGVTIGLQKDGSKNHRPGYDLCFHAPKSVSILALDGGDQRFHKAHLAAVKEVLNVIEEDCAQAKVFKNKKIGFENTRNLTVALVRHTASRELDPHLHHHVLIMNATKREDQCWRALASSLTKSGKNINGFSEQIYNQQIYYGLIYQSALANRIIKLGCEIETVGPHGLWEIKGVPKEARETVSKRRKQIEELIKKLPYHSKKAVDIAAKDSRERKPKNIKLEDMKKIWTGELAAVGFSSEKFLTELEKNKNEEITKPNGGVTIEAMEAVKGAITYLSQYRLKLDYIKIISQALEFSIGKTTHREIVYAVNQMMKDGQLIPLDKTDAVFVTKDLIETEKSIMELVNKKEEAAINLKDTVIDSLAAGQIKDCAVNVLQSKNRVILIESAQADNKNLITNILKLAEGSGKTIRVLSPNRLIANDINENIVRQPDTFWQWLKSLGKPEVSESFASFKHRYKEETDLPSLLLRFKQGKEVIVMNNAEALGCNDTKTMIELTAKTNAKVIFLQDVASKHGFDSGNSMETLKQAGIERIKLDEASITPAKLPELKVIKDDKIRTGQLAEVYAKQEDKERENTIVLVSSKEQLKVTNKAIRNELQSQGKLSNSERHIPVLNPVYMSEAEAGLAHQYQRDMVIRIYGRGMPEDWNVEHTNRDTNTIRLKQNKRMILWDPKKPINRAVFKREILPIAKGDRLIATSNMPVLGIKNGTKLVVAGINEEHIELTTSTNPGNLKIRLDEIKNSHFQYDYATTINRSLKKPVDNVIADFKAYLLNKATIDELTRRAKETLTIFTNDGEMAQKRFGHLPIKLTAAETLLDASKAIPADIKDNQRLDDKTIAEIKAEVEQAIEKLKEKYDFRLQPERKAVEFAVEKIASRNAGFGKNDIAKEALEYALKEVMAGQNKTVIREDIEKIIQEKHATGELVEGNYLNDGIKWTTQAALGLERSILATVKKGENKLAPLLDPQKISFPATDVNLTEGQKNAIALITTTRDQHTIIQGYAGVGKTRLFSQVHEMVKEANNNNQKKVKILGLAPTHKAVKELKNIGIKAQTLDSFLSKQIRMQKKLGESHTENKLLDNNLIILDEASMVSNEEFNRFAEIVDKSTAHVVYSGDRDQHTSIGSGKPYEITQKSNSLKTNYLKEIVRQTNPHLKEAVESVIGRNYKHAFDKVSQLNPQDYIERINHNPGDLELEFFKNLQTSVIEIDNEDLKDGEKTLEQMVAEDFLTRTPEVREQTVIIIHSNEDRATVTDLIRNGLKKQGVIEKQGTKVDCLTDKGLTNAEHKSLYSYGAGDVVKLGKQYYRVMEVDVKARSVLLKDGVGKTKNFYPEKEVDRHNMELYSHTKQELAIGDEIRLTKTDKKRGLFANFEYRVKAIDDKQVKLESKDKQPSIVLNHRKLKDSHWDYAQTVTSYGFQGGSKKYVIAFEVSYRKFLANVRSFYISISRAIEHLIIYTNSKSKFLQQLTENLGAKYSALEVTGELDKLTKTESTKLAKAINTKFYNVSEINQLLRNSVESVVERLLGRPNDKLSSTTEWRYGNKGSFAIKMAGDKKGLWRNFEAGETGNLITLIQKGMGLSYPETLKYVSETFGGVQTTFLSSKVNNTGNISKPSLDSKPNPEKEKTNKYARQLAAESVSIVGTLAEKYLKETRGIKNIDCADIRYHPKVYTGKNEKLKYLSAMLSIGRNKDGNIQCVQATYLNPKTVNKADLTVKKRTYASPSGALVSLQQRKINTDISFIAEGTETGLSVKDAVGSVKNSNVVVTLGKSNFTAIDPNSIGNRVVFCLDNDGPKTFADDTIHRAAKRLIGFGKEVFIAIPAINEKNTKIDFNDIARKEGIGAVKRCIDSAIPYKQFKLGDKNIVDNLSSKPERYDGFIKQQINKSIPPQIDKKMDLSFER